MADHDEHHEEELPSAASLILQVLGEISTDVRGVREGLVVETTSRSEQIAEIKRSRTRSNGAIILAILLFIAFSILAVRNANQGDKLQRQADMIQAQQLQITTLIDDAKIAGCERDNRFNASIVGGFDKFLTVLVNTSPPPATPEDAARRDAQVQAIRNEFAAALSNLAPRDCSRQALGLS